MNTPLPTITKACPECGRALIIRTNRQTDTPFLGCAGYPECAHTERVSENLMQRLQGAPELPLFDEPTAPAVRIEACRSCGAPIVWGKTAQGKACPFNVVGGQPTEESHFKTCPQARGWSRR
jgi:ssDNA-binding Zn-finger/Zn-ribbon topoisomerase 1